MQTNVNSPTFGCPGVDDNLNEEEEDEDEGGMPEVPWNKVDDGCNLEIVYERYTKTILADE